MASRIAPTERKRMGLFKQIFSDNRMLTAKDPDVQRTIRYHEDWTHIPSICKEHRSRRG